MSHTHDLAEWAGFLSLGVSVHATFSVPYFLFVGARLADFDPRPAIGRVIESGRLDLALNAAANAKHDSHRAADRARHIPRDAALTVAALAMLLTVSPEATR